MTSDRGGPDATGGGGPAAGQLSCSMASTLVQHVRGGLGEDAVGELLRLAAVDHTPAYLEDVSNWIWYEEAIALFEAAAELFDDQQIGRRIGEETVRQHAGTLVATVLRSLGSPEAVYEQLAVGVTKFSTVTELVPVEVVPGRAVISAKGRPGFKRHRHLCAWTAGMMSQPPVLFGLPSAKVEETSCEIRGDEECLYTITWDAERAARQADPEELVTALEAQLAAMTERLESMYATARDLIAPDDIDAALARITERAATAVRSPQHLLAVRTPDGQLHVHHRGLGEQDPQAAAHALLEDAGDEQDETRLVAEVASQTRHYGRLMAASLSGGFFPQERDMFEVYARFAASVLDTATALDDARHRHKESQALLELAKAVAAVSTSKEVAQSLVDAAPSVVDCDGVAVFLWSDPEQALTCRAITERYGEASGALRDLRIRPSDTPHVAELMENPEPSPFFFEANTPDAFVGAVMRQMGSSALIVVPIVAHGRFYGILNVSVTDRPERLRPNPALKDRLAGVVAQAATALENSRLMETMAHQARHDSLTGLLGHRAFHEALSDRVRDDDDVGAFTLATIDIDDFKLVNDLHGHPVGDQALLHVADALRGSVRGEDVVFRVGGEEFAVLLPGLSACDALPVVERLRAAVADTSFALPLRVSIGLASWPKDAADGDGLVERADAALYAAKHNGKDRTSVAGSDLEGGGVEGNSPRDLLNLLRGKDGRTLAHSAQVAALAVDVGVALGLDGDRLADLRIAGQLHAIGKVAVPDAVLNKPGPLDDEELRLVRTHPLVGSEIVRAWGLPRVAQIVLEHHERIDGAGYPAGHTGDQISMEGRVLHAVDAFAAMTTDRPYRTAMSLDDALAELRLHSGTQFDAEVVVALEGAVHERTSLTSPSLIALNGASTA
jgi:diguanylate cyclase (GGDEF)-like protein